MRPSTGFSLEEIKNVLKNLVEFGICCLMDLSLTFTIAVMMSEERHKFLEGYKYYQGSQVLELNVQKVVISVSVKSPHERTMKGL